MNGGRHDRSFGAVCLYVFLSFTLSLSNGQTILVVTGAPDLLVLLLDSSLCPCLSPFGFRCSRFCVRDHGALSLPLSMGGVDGGGGVGEGMKSQICFFIESRYGQNTGRCAVLFFLLWGKPPDRGDTTPRHEPGTGREQSRNTPLGG